MFFITRISNAIDWRDAMSDEVDAEIEALIAVVKILAPVTAEERQRILRGICGCACSGNSHERLTTSAPSVADK